jgi:hypothetical protein
VHTSVGFEVCHVLQILHASSLNGQQKGIQVCQVQVFSLLSSPLFPVGPICPICPISPCSRLCSFFLPKGKERRRGGGRFQGASRGRCLIGCGVLLASARLLMAPLAPAWPDWLNVSMSSCGGGFPSQATTTGTATGTGTGT